MDTQFAEFFISRWKRYFADSELPMINYPYVEAQSEHPRCILGMFDVSARPCVPARVLTFAVPMKRFEQMVLNMDESFLITESWNLVRNRLPA